RGGRPPSLRRGHSVRRAPGEAVPADPVIGTDNPRSKLMASATTLASIPFQGSGLGYRNELKKSIWEHRSEIDCLEVITDRYIDDPQLTPELEELCDSFRVIP